MLIQKRILSADRMRRTPPSFSWVDHRLLRQRYLMRAPAKAWALYLVLVAAGDEHGLSYYSDVSVGRLLALRADEVAAALGRGRDRVRRTALSGARPGG